MVFGIRKGLCPHEHLTGTPVTPQDHLGVTRFEMAMQNVSFVMFSHFIPAFLRGFLSTVRCKNESYCVLTYTYVKYCAVAVLLVLNVIAVPRLH